MQDTEAFFEELGQQVRLRAAGTSNFTKAAMAELACEWLENEGEIEEFNPAHYDVRGMRVDGYGFSEKDDAVDLFVVDWSPEATLKSLTQTEVRQEFKRLKNLFVKAATSNLHEELEESSPVYGLAWSLSKKASTFGRLRLFLVSNRLLSSRVDTLENEAIGSWQVSFYVWDIQRLARLHDTKAEPIIINFKRDFSRPLPCLPAHLESGDYQSYLVVVPGRTLADLYGKHGSRLLELNVRTFLQVRGRVNKGIRNTIQNEPHMFFAYNNGITATADGVSTKVIDGMVHIEEVINLQIVNGGQTTASLYHAGRAKADLSGVFVQMKLSVVKPELSVRVAPRIAEYANTQNKVSAADFFSNHAFHVRMELTSRRVWAPAVDGSQRQSKWFYERARGQYAEAQSSLTKAQQNTWRREYPREQVFTKTDIAKFDNVWDGYPVEVNRGAQKNFAHYAQRISETWERDDALFNDRYFMRAIARAITFRATEKLVSGQPWYQGGYRANIVAYSQALLGQKISQAGLVPDWDGIWTRQALTPAFLEALTACAEKVNAVITDTPENIRNVTEWCKKKLCWERVQQLDVPLSGDLMKELVNLSEERDRSREAKGQRIVDNGIEAQKEVLRRGGPFWGRLDGFCREHRVGISPKERGVLDVAVSIPARVPSDRQSILLLGLLERMEGEGFQVDS
jgi:hypothetical protein